MQICPLGQRCETKDPIFCTFWDQAKEEIILFLGNHFRRMSDNMSQCEKKNALKRGLVESGRTRLPSDQTDRRKQRRRVLLGGAPDRFIWKPRGEKTASFTSFIFRCAVCQLVTHRVPRTEQNVLLPDTGWNAAQIILQIGGGPPGMHACAHTHTHTQSQTHTKCNTVVEVRKKVSRKCSRWGWWGSVVTVLGVWFFFSPHASSPWRQHGVRRQRSLEGRRGRRLGWRVKQKVLMRFQVKGQSQTVHLLKLCDCYYDSEDVKQAES